MKKILLVDDHVVVRAGIKGLLENSYPGSEIDEAGDGDAALERLSKENYDIMLLDVQMPNTDSLSIMTFIHNKYPSLKVLVFSMSAENIYAGRFMKEGAKGFLSKDAPMAEIKKAIQVILSDGIYISDKFARSFAEESLSGKSANPFEKLSPREFEITSLLLSGQTISEMSKALNLQVSTVGTHKSRVFEKLQVNNILELKELARSYNL